MDVDRASLFRLAAEYISQGWRVFPLVGGTKLPATSNGVLDATVDYDKVHDWFGLRDRGPNIGVAAGGGLLIVDLDRHGEANGLVTWNELTEVNPTPDTYRVLTPTGGVHLYFTVDREIRNSAGKLGPGIDTRGDGGYVVAPPSVVDGKPYVRIGFDPPQPAPRWLLEALDVKRVTPVPAATSGYTAALMTDFTQRAPGQAYHDAALRSGYERVASAMEGTRNQALNDETYSLAGIPGIDLNEVIAVMTDAGIAAGLPHPEAAVTASRAAGAGGSAPRDIAMSTHLPAFTTGQGGAFPQVSPSGPGAVPPFDLVSDDALDNEPGLEWIIDGVLPTGFCALYGQSGHGKSFVGLSMAFSITSGRSFFGHVITRPGAVIYCANEGARGVGPRRHAWQVANQSQTRGFHHLRAPIDLAHPADVDRLIATARKVRPVVMFIDTWARSFSGDENSSQDVGRAIRGLDHLRDQTGTNIVLVHHSGVDDTRMRGSTALKGALDWIGVVWNRNGTIELHDAPPAGKTKDGPPMQMMRFDLRPIAGSAVLERRDQAPAHSVAWEGAL